MIGIEDAAQGGSEVRIGVWLGGSEWVKVGAGHWGVDKCIHFTFVK